MLHRIRTGDILLAENKEINQTNAYLVIYSYSGEYEGFGLMCLSCGSLLGSYGKGDKAKKQLEKDIKGFLNVKYIVPKECISEFFNNNYKLKFPVKDHDIPEDYELGLEIEI